MKSSLLLAALGAVLFSAKAIVVKLCYRYGADTESVLALRMLFALPFFWGAVAWHAAVKRPTPVGRRDLLAMLFLGFMGYYVASYLDFLSLRYISVGLERIILYLNPTIVLVLSAWLFGRRIGARQWQAMAVAYAGVALVFLHDVRFDGDAAVLGGSLAFLGAVAYAIYLVYSGEIVHRVGSIRMVAYASGSASARDRPATRLATRLANRPVVRLKASPTARRTVSRISWSCRRRRSRARWD